MDNAVIDQEKFEELKNIISNGEWRKAKIHFGIDSTVNIETTIHTGVHIAAYNGKLILQRIELRNQRKGTGTAILNWLKRYAIEHDYKAFIVESVGTKPMSNLCRNLEYEFSPGYSNQPENFKGDYIFMIKKEFESEIFPPERRKKPSEEELEKMTLEERLDAFINFQ